ncbi:uncharacterized protein [Narcine bancroftii]|uniref:uncharacterized protein n=1 Tax=Narcine bancroftii TaxID=1343680 RepID=UPI0038311195
MSALWTQMANLHHTRAYHPQSNGLVERHLKASLLPRLSGPDRADELLCVLLGIRTAPKEDQQPSAAAMVYGALLSLLGEIFGPDTDTTATDKNLLADLCRRLASQAPSPLARHGIQSFQLSKVLDSAQFIFVRRGPQGAPLQRLYEGPYKVLHRSGRTFTLDVGGERGTFYSGPPEGSPSGLITASADGRAQALGLAAKATGRVAGSGKGCVVAHILMANRPHLYHHVAGTPWGNGAVRGFSLTLTSLPACTLGSDYDITMHQVTELMLPLKGRAEYE